MLLLATEPGGLATRRFNRQRNGYRMRCKPPLDVDSHGVVSSLSCRAFTPVHGRQERTRNRAGRASPGHPGRRANGLPASSATDGQHRRNAVGAHGVKLDAAPDAPSWGPVLACSPPVPVRIQRRAAAATDIHPSPHRYTGQVQAAAGGPGCDAVRPSPAVWACRDFLVPVLTRGSAPASRTTGQAASEGRARRPGATAHRGNAGKRGDGGQHDNWPGRSAGA
jgi:hypothetical protein